MVWNLVVVACGAVIGAYIRWGFGFWLNPVFPTLPLGTLAANVVGGFLIGIFMEVGNIFHISQSARLALVTGFLGALTTFSTFSAESVSLLSSHQYFWFGIHTLTHLVGSIGATILAIFIVKSLMV